MFLRKISREHAEVSCEHVKVCIFLFFKRPFRGFVVFLKKNINLQVILIIVYQSTLIKNNNYVHKKKLINIP